MPFALLDEVQNDESQKSSSNHLSLYYVGRISEQKNLHSLFWALSIYVKKSQAPSISLDIFGGEDNLGSPNMGRTSGPYLQILIKLAQDLGLNEIVKFHGFTDRNLIAQKVRSGRKVFVSPSLHADENFGMAALRALSMGHYALLSDWGGHADYVATFKNMVSLVDVQISKTGPFLVIPDLVKKIERIASIADSYEAQSLPSYYQLSQIQDQLRDIFYHQEASSLQFMSCVELLAKRWSENSKEEPHSSRVFNSFEDEIFHRFSMAYSGRTDYYGDKSIADLYVAPWVEFVENKIRIEDPHRGNKEIIEATAEDKNKWLREHGYAFNENDF